MPIEEAIRETIESVYVTAFSSPAVESFARSGPYLLRLLFAGDCLADEFASSFLHEQIGNPDLHVGFLTSGDVDLSHLIPRPWSEQRAIASGACFAMWQAGEQPILYLLDRESKRALIWLAAGTAPDWVASRPALPIMLALSVETEWALLHAAAVGRNGRVLLLPSDPRAGKTTAALSCAQAGWDYAGDDFVFANSKDGSVEPLYGSARLRTDVASAFPDFLTHPTQISKSDGEPRYELRLGHEHGRCRVRGGTLAAILLLQRKGEAYPRFTPARRSDAIAGLKTSITLAISHFHHAARGEAVEKIIKMTGLGPIFFVDTGQHPARIPSAFGEFLDRL